jgi:hypothetical protein
LRLEKTVSTFVLRPPAFPDSLSETAKDAILT